MARWRNIPAQFSWDGESMTPASTKAHPQKVRPSKVSTAVLPPESPEKPPEALPLSNLAGLSDEEKIAALKTEAALDTILALVPDQEVIETKPEPAKIADPQKCPVTGQNSLWENPVQDLPMGNSAIYPDGRPLSNPNHMMLFVGHGAEVVRDYTQTGWVSYLRRPDGRRNPVPESLVETFIKSGILKEGKPGIFRGA